MRERLREKRFYDPCLVMRIELEHTFAFQ